MDLVCLLPSFFFFSFLFSLILLFSSLSFCEDRALRRLKKQDDVI